MLDLDGTVEQPADCIPKDSWLIVDDKLTTISANWLNVVQDTPGRGGWPYCAKKNSVASEVVRAYGYVDGYVPGKPFAVTWWEKTAAEGEWEPHLEYQRDLGYAPEQLVLVRKLWAVSSDPLYVSQFIVRRVSVSEWAGTSDLKRTAYFGDVDVAPYTDASHQALIPNAMERLRNGGTLKLCLCGDSYQNFTTTTPVEALIQRMYPQCEVLLYGACAGSAGVSFWKQNNRIRDIVAPNSPDVVVVGGISSYGNSENPENWQPAEDWADVVGQIRTYVPGAEVILGSSGNGLYNTSDWVRAIAADNDCAFYDTSTMINDLANAMGTTTTVWIDAPYGDGIHFGDVGTTGLGRGLAKFFAPV